MSSPIEKLKAEIQSYIEARKKATDGPWHNLDINGKPDKKVRCNSHDEINWPDIDERYEKLRACRGEVANTLSYDKSKMSKKHTEAVNNATFIALAANQSAQMASQLLEAIEVIEFYAVMRHPVYQDRAAKFLTKLSKGSEK